MTTYITHQFLFYVVVRNLITSSDMSGKIPQPHLMHFKGVGKMLN